DSHFRDTIRYQYTREVDRGSGNAGGAGSANGVFLDKLWMVFDHHTGNLYIAYTRFDGAEKNGNARSSMLVSKSTDKGNTWSKPIKLNQPTDGNSNIRNQGNVLAVDPRNGDVYAYWRDYYEPHILMVRSTDGGTSWSRPKRITDQFPLNLYDQPSIQNTVNPAKPLDGKKHPTFRAKAYPTATIDGNGVHYVAIHEAAGESAATYSGVTYRGP